MTTARRRPGDRSPAGARPDDDKQQRQPTDIADVPAGRQPAAPAAAASSTPTGGRSAGSRSAGERSAGERLVGDMAEVVREEAREVRADVAEAVRPAASGLLLVGAAAGCAVMAVGAASTTVLRMLETFLPRRLAAAGLTAGYVAGAVALGGAGLRQLQAAGGRSGQLADQIRETLADAMHRPGQAGRSGTGEDRVP